MRPVNIRVRHDDDFVVAQICWIVAAAGLHTQGLQEVVDLLVLGKFAGTRAGHIQDFAP